MSVVDTTASQQRVAISFEIDLPHAPSKVWRALTEPALLAEWLLPAAGFALERGKAFTLTAPPQPGWDGTVDCRVVEIEPGRKLGYTWRVGEIDTVVTFSLAPTPTGSRLSVVQSGFKPDQKRNFGGARYGWRMMGDKLVDLLSRIP
jgi:uncharacterized protein YndB with AHSA1/START domain